MNKLKTCIFAVLIGGLFACANLTAGTMTLGDLTGGETDTISITLDPFSGSVDGAAGSTVGWGFTVLWTSTSNDWITFTSSNLAGDTNPDLSAGYTDYIGAQGGPDDYSVATSDSPWTESFDDVADTGVGAYQITSDPTIALPDAEDTGQIVFNFQVYNGDPFNGGTQIGDGSYAYSADFSVEVSSTPEPATYALFLAGIGMLFLANRRRKGRGAIAHSPTMS